MLLSLYFKEKKILDSLTNSTGRVTPSIKVKV